MDTRRPKGVLSSPRFRGAVIDGLALLVAVALGVAAFTAVARAPMTVGPASTEFSVGPSLSPRTVIELPPFGRVSAATHRGPVTFRVRLDEVDVPRTQRMIERGEISIPATLSGSSASELPVQGLSNAVWRVVGGGLIAAGVAGALVGLAMRRRRAIVGAAVALALLVPSVAVGVGYSTWSAAAFREPTLEGGLAYAPRLIDLVSTRVGSIERLREKAGQVARDLAVYYADDRSFAPGGPLSDTYRVMHVTDLHLDPVGAELARQVARSYEASLVIDTGDLPILGAPVESSLFASLVDTSIPRVYVPGNHDSPASVAALEQLGVTVLTSGTVEVDGIRIFGIPDPISRGFGVEPRRGVIEQAGRDESTRLIEALRSGEPTPTVIAMHNPAMERSFIGLAPLLLSGHTHSARLYTSGSSVRLNSGTLGGMPYDPQVSGKRSLPYSASVLYFTGDEPRRLVAVDRIAVSPNRTTTVTRDVIDEMLLP